jgi:hypothetical protein
LQVSARSEGTTGCGHIHGLWAGPPELCWNAICRVPNPNCIGHPHSAIPFCSGPKYTGLVYGINHNHKFTGIAKKLKENISNKFLRLELSHKTGIEHGNTPPKCATFRDGRIRCPSLLKGKLRRFIKYDRFKMTIQFIKFF